MQKILSQNEKLTIRALRAAIDNVFEEMGDNLQGSLNQVKKNKRLIRQFSAELIKNVVNNYDDVDGVAKVLKEISESIDVFADALSAGRGEDVLRYLQLESEEIQNTSKSTAKKEVTNKQEQPEAQQDQGVVQRVDASEIKKFIDSEKQKNDSAQQSNESAGEFVSQKSRAEYNKRPDSQLERKA